MCGGGIARKPPPKLANEPPHHYEAVAFGVPGGATGHVAMAQVLGLEVKADEAAIKKGHSLSALGQQMGLRLSKAGAAMASR